MLTLSFHTMQEAVLFSKLEGRPLWKLKEHLNTQKTFELLEEVFLEHSNPLDLAHNHAHTQQMLSKEVST